MKDDDERARFASDPARRGPGRPPGSRNAPKNPPVADGTDDDTADDPDEPMEVRRICGMEFTTRRNGTFPPPIVRKISIAQQARGMSQEDIVARIVGKGIEIGKTKLYNWRAVSGSPNSEQTAALSEILDVSLDYLVDDNIPEMADPPRHRQYKQPDIQWALSLYGLHMMDLEKYLRVIGMAKDLGIEPGQAVRILIDGYAEIQAYRKANNPNERPNGSHDHLRDWDENGGRKKGG